MKNDELFFNATRIEDDPFEPINSNDYETASNFSKQGYYDVTALQYLFIAAYILEALICIFVVAADMFLISMFIKFKYLRTRTNFYFLNYTIINLVYMVLIRGVAILFGAFPYYLWCLIVELENALLGLNFVIMFITALDWFLTAYKPTVLKHYQKTYKYLFLIIYFLGVVKLIAFSSTCLLPFETNNPITSSIIIVLYSISIISVLSMYFIKRKRQVPDASKKTEYSINISLYILLSWLPLAVIHTIVTILSLFQMISEVRIAHHIFVLLSIIPLLIAYGFPIIIVYLLGRLNKNFKMAYDTCFKKSVQAYQTENLDDIEGSENDRNQVSYDPLAEEPTTILV